MPVQLSEVSLDASGRGSPTIIGGYVAAVARALDARGIDSRKVLAAAGITVALGNDPMQRIGVGSVISFFDAAAKAAADPYFGLHAAAHLHAGSLHAMGFAMLASASLRDLGARLARYFRFLANTTTLVVEDDPAEVRIRFRYLTRVPDMSADIFGLFLVRMIADLSEGAVRPVRVALHRPTPPDAGISHRRAFGCPVTFESEDSVLAFPGSQRDTPFSSGSAELAAMSDRVIVEYLAKLDRNDIRSRVRNILMRDMPAGTITKEQISAKLFMSPRTLQIKLSKCGTTFHDLLSETRESLACGYMANSAILVTEIAYLVGYSDTSNFSRAFRRWTGLSPSDYRLRALSGAATPSVEAIVRQETSSAPGEARQRRER